MKILVTICSGIIMTGVAYSLYNAANDYGLATISLPPAIIAQDDDTSGDGTSGDGTNGGKVECNGYSILCDQYLHREVSFVNVISDNNGSFTVCGYTFLGYKRNFEYSVQVTDYSCRPHDNSKNVCVRSEERTEVSKTPTEGHTTSGDSTNRH